jgi:threonine dehydratase
MSSQHPLEASEEVGAVGVDPEEGLAIAAPRVDVVDASGREISRGARHEPTVAAAPGSDAPCALTVTLSVQLPSRYESVSDTSLNDTSLKVAVFRVDERAACTRLRTIARVEGLPIGRGDIERAAGVIAGRLHRTPTLSCRTLGPHVFLKAELLQRTGSFKPRGVLTKLASLTEEEKRRGVIAASAGNHAAALAFGAALEGTDALVVMYQGASEVKLRAAEAYGATIDLEATGPGDVFDRLDALQQETGRVLVHPFDDPLVVAGQGTVGLEILEDVPDVRRIVVPCGGGGLVSGIAVSAAATDIEIVAVEPESSRALHAALEAGETTPVDARSVADGLNAPFAGGLALDIAQKLGVEPVLVTEEEIAAGFRFLYERAKLACEPAGAAAVAAVLAGKVEGDHTVCVVSGGNVAAQTAAGILATR